jgi:hypothetical protein
MTPERTLSQVGTLLVRLCKSNKLPEAWSAGDLVKLAEQYSQLLRVINDGKPDPGQDQDIEEIFEKGRPGSYQAMVRRAEAMDRQASRKSKRKQGKIRKD